MDVTEFPESLCRLCLMPTPSASLTELRTGDNRDNSVTSKINTLIGKDIISNNDGLPQVVCSVCIDKVNTAHNLVKNIVTNHEKLKYLTAPMNTPEADNVSNDIKTDVMSECISFDDGAAEISVKHLSDEEDDEYERFTVLIKEEIEEENVVEQEQQMENTEEEITMIDDTLYNGASDVDDTVIINTVCSEPDSVTAVKENNRKITKQRSDCSNYDCEEIDEYFSNYGGPVSSLYRNRKKFVQFGEDGRPSNMELDFSDYDAIDSEIADILSWLDEQNDYYRIHRCRRCKSVFVGQGEPYSHACNGTTYNDGKNRANFSSGYMCAYCKKVLASRFLLALHIDQLHKEEQTIVYMCDYCNIVLENEINLTKHIRTVHKVEYERNDGDNDDKPKKYHRQQHQQQQQSKDVVNNNNNNSNSNNDDYDVMTEVCSEQCDICGKITSQLEQHKMFHAIENLETAKTAQKQGRKAWLTCEECGKKLPTMYAFIFHKAEHRGQKEVVCEQCGFRSCSLAEYAVHHSTHTGEKTYVCNDCEKCFQTRSAITDHVLLHMDGMRYMCEICGKQFKTCRAHAQHKLLQHRRYLRCVRCNRGFSNAEKMKTHLDVCLTITTAPEINDKSSTMVDNNRESDNNTGVIGSSSSSNNNNHNNNSISTTNLSQRAYCVICKSYIKCNSEITMMFHYAKHEGKDGIPCKECGVLCKNVYTYKNHSMIHSEERPFRCLQCDKCFRTKGCLVQHMLVHGNEYKYSCNFCGKKSKKLTTHINHVNIHTDTRPYKCPDCFRPFRQLSDMKKHRKTHLKTKQIEHNVLAAGLAFVPLSLEIKEELMNADNVIF